MAKMYSLIMGIENYPEISGQTKVNYAGNDVKAMADYARKAGFHLIDDKPLLDGEATYKKVIKKLGYLFDIAEEDDFILLYFAGHGFYSDYGGFLIPFDYQKENAIDESSCISFNSIKTRLDNKKTRHFIFFLDTCHSGYAVKQIDIRAAESRDIHITPEAVEKVKSQINEIVNGSEKIPGIGRLVFTSSAANEKSYHTDEFQHGLFTHYLLSGLKSRTNEKQVNVEDLVRSVKENVSKFCFDNNWKQTPTVSLNIEGDFFLPAYEIQPREGELVSAPDFSQDIQKARKALQSKDFDSAARIINAILQKDSLNFEANLLLEELDTGRNLQILKEKTEKRQHYEEWLRRGEGFRKAGEFSKAKECFENAARIYPDNPMAQSYIKEIDTREQIIRVDDIEVPVGAKADILKNLFQSANGASNIGDFTAALNHYNKILKTYPGNQRAIKEKLQLFEKWLLQYKDSARYFEILGLLENIILPDESMRDDHVRFEGEYNETILLYTQAFLKSRISSEIEPVIKEIKKKEERKEAFEKLLNEYHELAMEKEYNELLKITDKIKNELDRMNDRIKLKSEIIGIKNIFETQEKAVSDHVFTILESLINEGITDKYILNTYKQIENKLKDQKDADEWDLSYKKFNIFSISLYSLLDVYIWTTILTHYYHKSGGYLMDSGPNFMLIVSFCMLLIPLYSEFKPSIAIKKSIIRRISYELGKFGVACSVSIICYINMLSNLETFFNWYLILITLLFLIVSFVLSGYNINNDEPTPKNEISRL
ncbi:MAG: caspase family protein [Candidatus Aminicenantes bacterium]|nr:caspase family protein [Candidatus Aminicenantes bacterium]